MANPYETYSDVELLDLMKIDDQIAFERIYIRYWETLLKSSYRILKDRDACFDVLQEVFLWLWQNRTRIEVRSIKFYLLAATRYQIANRIRKEKVKQTFLDHSKSIKIDEFYDADDLEFKEFKQMILTFIDKLPERCKEIFQLSRNEHLSNKDIAKQLGISEKTVENQLTIALKKLKIKMGANYIFIFFF